jgi:solute carrier family 25 aspartate/glutamate transporter 12/13
MGNRNSTPAATKPDEPKLVDGQKLISLLRQTAQRHNVYCETNPTRKVDYASDAVTTVPRANLECLRQVFEKYATVEDTFGQRYIKNEDFIIKYLGLLSKDNYNRETMNILSSAADTTKNGLISFEEFSAFEAILCSPDALYLTAFSMFDANASESITVDEFLAVIKQTSSVVHFDFNMESDFVKLYFGREKKRAISYPEFCQFLHDFHDEQAIQAFKSFDRNRTGYITAVDFSNLMTTVKQHMLSAFVRSNLVAVAGGHATSMVSFPWFMAFNEMVAKIELFKRIYMSSARNNLNYEMTREEFLQASQAYGQVTPLEVSILFQLSELRHPGNGHVLFQDLEKIDPERLKRVTDIIRLTDVRIAETPQQRGPFIAILESLYRFTLGSIAGACGATAVYPIDLVKTRIQNQRTGSYIGELMYKNSFDCFRKVIRHEGLMGLYRGLLPQLVGVAPEKAIKLTMNDLVRDKMTTGGRIPIWGECLAGACGGGSQVLFTNPLEIVKIRLQVAGEIQKGPKVNVFSVIRDLGFFGLYKGARACFLRDIPFSAIYFPVYAHAKIATADDNGHNNALSLLASACVAGVPAAFLVTPADVIKTRLQVAARAGQTTYNGLFDCYRKILREEGFKAFWKGSVARVFRSSPQFGVTLVTYEMLQRVFYMEFGGQRPTGSERPAHKTLLDERSDNPDHVGGYKLASATFASIESKFGLVLPKFEARSVAKKQPISN